MLLSTLAVFVTTALLNDGALHAAAREDVCFKELNVQLIRVLTHKIDGHILNVFITDYSLSHNVVNIRDDLDGDVVLDDILDGL